MTRKYAVSVNGRNLDLREMSRDEVIQIKDEVTESLLAIKDQIGEAKAYKGEYSDPKWFRKAESARRHVGNSILKINRWLGTMPKKPLVDPRPKPLSKFFMQVANDCLDKDTFQKIYIEARYRKYKHEESNQSPPPF